MIINTARGEIIDTAGLIKGLKNDSVKAAGLDVLEEEEFYLEKIKKISTIWTMNLKLRK